MTWASDTELTLVHDTVRRYAHLKMATVAAYRLRQGELLTRQQVPVPVGASATRRSAR
ncbi:hypothetical protein GCM10023080_066710 [Streptomyces pseudoechinosporeus]